MESEKRKKLAIKALKKKGYKYEEIIGQGAFGAIYSFKTSAKEIIAAKVILKQMTNNYEISAWPYFDHVNVLPVIEIKQLPAINVFLMPLLSKSMNCFLNDEQFKNKHNSFDTVLTWLSDVLHGLEYLHSNQFCHLDLKSDNVLISALNAAVICDFSCVNTTEEKVSGYGVFPSTRPPEACVYSGHGPKVWGALLDIWSVGIIALQSFTGLDKFHRRLNSRNKKTISIDCQKRHYWLNIIYPVLRDILEPVTFSRLMNGMHPSRPITEKISYLALNLIQGIFRFDPHQRPRISDILRHSLFSGSNRESLLETDPVWDFTVKEYSRDMKNTSDKISNSFRRQSLTDADFAKKDRNELKKYASENDLKQVEEKREVDETQKEKTKILCVQGNETAVKKDKKKWYSRVWKKMKKCCCLG